MSSKLLYLVPGIFIFFATMFLFMYLDVGVFNWGIVPSFFTPNPPIGALVIAIFFYLVSFGILCLFYKTKESDRKRKRIDKEGIESTGTIVDFAKTSFGDEIKYVPIIQFKDTNNQIHQSRDQILLSEEQKKELETKKTVKIKFFEDVCELQEPLKSNHDMTYYEKTREAMRKEETKWALKNKEKRNIHILFYTLLLLTLLSLTVLIVFLVIYIKEKEPQHLAVAFFAAWCLLVFGIFTIIQGRTVNVLKKGTQQFALSYTAMRDEQIYKLDIVFLNESHEQKRCKATISTSLYSMIEELGYLPIRVYKNKAFPDADRIKEELINILNKPRNS